MMGPYIDIPGPEISAGSRMMSWFFDEYSKYKRFSPASVTGKVCLYLYLYLSSGYSSGFLKACCLCPVWNQPYSSCLLLRCIFFTLVACLLLPHGLLFCFVWLSYLIPKQCASDLQPVDLHGSHGREYATGRGAVLATRELLLHAHAGKIANKDFVIQVRFLPANHFTASGPVVQQQECVGCHITTAGQLLLHSCKNKRFLLIIAKASVL